MKESPLQTSQEHSLSQAPFLQWQLICLLPLWQLFITPERQESQLSVLPSTPFSLKSNTFKNLVFPISTSSYHPGYDCISHNCFAHHLHLAEQFTKDFSISCCTKAFPRVDFDSLIFQFI